MDPVFGHSVFRSKLYIFNLFQVLNWCHAQQFGPVTFRRSKNQFHRLLMLALSTMSIKTPIFDADNGWNFRRIYFKVSTLDLNLSKPSITWSGSQFNGGTSSELETCENGAEIFLRRPHYQGLCLYATVCDHCNMVYIIHKDLLNLHNFQYHSMYLDPGWDEKCNGMLRHQFDS